MNHVVTAVVATTLGASCASTGHLHDHAAHQHEGHHAFASADAAATTLDDPARDAWQRPEDVVRALDLAPTMTVADVGAGTGYFTLRLARAVPAGEVIATDLEPDMVRYVTERARREDLHNVRATLASQTGSGLAAKSVDRILVVHVWHHLAGRVAYARDLAAALRPGGRLFIVDFGHPAARSGSASVDPAAHPGPPAHMRLSPDAVIRELAAAGLTARALAVALPDQYIVEGRLPSERP